MLKRLMQIVSVLMIIILVLIFTVLRYYSGDEGFEKLEGSWQGTIGEDAVTFEIYKGSRAIKGFTYGYLELMDESGEVLSTHRIKFKDQKVFETGDVSGEIISLNLIDDDSLLKGDVELIVNTSGKVLKGDLSAEKNK
jgi:hypothetical protein